MVKSFLKCYFVLIAFVYSSSLFSQTAADIFKGGSEFGNTNASKTNSACSSASLNPFTGGLEGGNTSNTKTNSVCSIATLNPFSGGNENGASVSNQLNAVCAPVTLNPFSGGVASVSSSENLVNSACEPTSISPFFGGTNDGFATAFDVNSDCYFQTSTITSVSSSACPGGTIVITGTGLFGVSSVTINGLAAPDFTVNSSFSISVTVPFGATSGPLLVNGSGGLAAGPNPVTILPAPTISVSPSGPLSLCLGPAVLIASSDATIYNWSTEATTSSISVNQAGNYFVTVTGSNGCRAKSDTVVVIEANFPIAGFSWSQNNGFSVQFTNTGSEATIYAWDFGNGNTSSLENPEFVFPVEGNYPVTLISSNDCGSDTSTIIVNVITTLIDKLSGTEVQISPNPFHDVLKVQVQMNTLTDLQVNIFNMLGQQVYNERIIGQKEKILLIDLSTLAPGVYSVILGNSYGNLTRKVVKN